MSEAGGSLSGVLDDGGLNDDDLLFSDDNGIAAALLKHLPSGSASLSKHSKLGVVVALAPGLYKFDSSGLFGGVEKPHVVRKEEELEKILNGAKEVNAVSPLYLVPVRCKEAEDSQTVSSTSAEAITTTSSGGNIMLEDSASHVNESLLPSSENLEPIDIDTEQLHELFPPGENNSPELEFLLALIDSHPISSSDELSLEQIRGVAQLPHACEVTIPESWEEEESLSLSSDSLEPIDIEYEQFLELFLPDEDNSSELGSIDLDFIYSPDELSMEQIRGVAQRPHACQVAIVESWEEEMRYAISIEMPFSFILVACSDKGIPLSVFRTPSNKRNRPPSAPPVPSTETEVAISTPSALKKRKRPTKTEGATPTPKKKKVTEIQIDTSHLTPDQIRHNPKYRNLTNFPEIGQTHTGHHLDLLTTKSSLGQNTKHVGFKTKPATNCQVHQFGHAESYSEDLISCDVCWNHPAKMLCPMQNCCDHKGFVWPTNRDHPWYSHQRWDEAKSEIVIRLVSVAWKKRPKQLQETQQITQI